MLLAIFVSYPCFGCQTSVAKNSQVILPFSSHRPPASCYIAQYVNKDHNVWPWTAPRSDWIWWNGGWEDIHGLPHRGRPPPFAPYCCPERIIFPQNKLLKEGPPLIQKNIHGLPLGPYCLSENKSKNCSNMMRLQFTPRYFRANIGEDLDAPEKAKLNLLTFVGIFDIGINVDIGWPQLFAMK